MFIWLAPSSSTLWIACYCLSHGSLASAVITWRNSLVFHDWDKVTSLFVHIYAPLVFTVIRCVANLQFSTIVIVLTNCHQTLLSWCGDAFSSCFQSATSRACKSIYTQWLNMYVCKAYFLIPYLTRRFQFSRHYLASIILEGS